MLVGSTSAQAGSIPPLGAAQNYNVFILGNDSQSGTDAQGQVAVGGTATFSSYGVATNLTNAADALVVGQGLSYKSGSIDGSVFVGQAGSFSSSAVLGNLTVGQGITFDHGSIHGNLVYGTTATLAGGPVHGTTTKVNPPAALPIDFASAATSLTGLSTSLSHLGGNGTATVNYGLYLSGTNATLDVFNLTSGQLAKAIGYGLHINAPSTATVLINVPDANPVMQNYAISFTGGATDAHTLFNFYSAKTLTAASIGIEGSVLAPGAALMLSNGDIDGTLIGASLQGQNGGSSNFEAHNVPFTGTFADPPNPQATPEPATITLAATGGLILGFVYLRRRRSSRPAVA